MLTLTEQCTLFIAIMISKGKQDMHHDFQNCGVLQSLVKFSLLTLPG